MRAPNGTKSVSKAKVLSNFLRQDTAGKQLLGRLNLAVGNLSFLTSLASSSIPSPLKSAGTSDVRDAGDQDPVKEPGGVL